MEYSQLPLSIESESCLRLVVVQNHWVSGLCLSSGILNTRKHNVSYTASVSALR
jgi:hypothetical protein